ncbi:hypothetical protein PFISCL1PPCAC_10835 [Pristionchus fissidentatus]|uniref:Uncharacterized protein n=1 Tax=Pristionchus fissidentatus TaxID=1538716 RepID=A0AAV5VMM9_9BILA|nr:hypothetical protein PFISCL1PPCAC_10835 [Pristionchus fissidentatus]
MVQPLQRLRPEFFNETETLFDTITMITSNPPIILSVKRMGDPERGLSATTNDGNNVAHYAGTVDGLMFFYATQPGLLFNDLPILMHLTTHQAQLTQIRKAESSNVQFFHRQPYYLNKTGILTTKWHLHNFQRPDPVEIELNGISITDSILIYHRKLIILLRNGEKDKRWRENEQVTIVTNPRLNKDCTVYTGDHLDHLFISLSNEPAILVFTPQNMAMESIKLPECMDIRCVHEGTMIGVSEFDDILYSFKLENRLWMSNAMLLRVLAEMQGQNVLSLTHSEHMENKLFDARQAMNASQREVESLQKQLEQAQNNIEKRKKLGRELAQANTRISLLRKEINEAENKFMKERISWEKRRIELTTENSLLQQRSYAIAAGRVAAETSKAEIQMEIDDWMKKNEEMEKKYRRMLLMFGRSNMSDRWAEEIEREEKERRLGEEKNEDESQFKTMQEHDRKTVPTVKSPLAVNKQSNGSSKIDDGKKCVDNVPTKSKKSRSKKNKSAQAK